MHSIRRRVWLATPPGHLTESETRTGDKIPPPPFVKGGERSFLLVRVTPAVPFIRASKSRGKKCGLRPETAGPCLGWERQDHRPNRHEADIILAFHRHEGNVSAMERDLRKKGIKYSRKTISKILDDLELPRGRRKG